MFPSLTFFISVQRAKLFPFQAALYWKRLLHKSLRLLGIFHKCASCQVASSSIAFLFKDGKKSKTNQRPFFLEERALVSLPMPDSSPPHARFYSFSCQIVFLHSITPSTAEPKLNLYCQDKYCKMEGDLAGVKRAVCLQMISCHSGWLLSFLGVDFYITEPPDFIGRSKVDCHPSVTRFYASKFETLLLHYFRAQEISQIILFK